MRAGPLGGSLEAWPVAAAIELAGLGAAVDGSSLVIAGASRQAVAATAAAAQGSVLLSRRRWRACGGSPFPRRAASARVAAALLAVAAVAIDIAISTTM